MVKLIECPRDAMQGLHEFIPTDTKVAYINKLLQVGFDTIDFGSFVSPKAIPQMADTAQVLERLNLDDTNTKLLAIVANMRGANDAVKYPQIDYLGYPFSISETFQIRNTNATIAESLDRVKGMQELCTAHNKTLVVYLSMGFGNPYGDEWNAEIVMKWMNELAKIGVHIVSLSDTIGVSTTDSIEYLFSHVIPEFPEIEIGAHLHTLVGESGAKIKAAYQSGCRRFDGALKGYGGCPMAKDDLTGNMPMENLIFYFAGKNEINIDMGVLYEAMEMAESVFPARG
ncbi:MAG TPA: hydroxymethylglutaryl-CoA lyase [Saprospiraceae bacterium]|nr:hydroxymethylglutaryl-CoA lyase [Saprospiraceae bacterium]